MNVGATRTTQQHQEYTLVDPELASDLHHLESPHASTGSFGEPSIRLVLQQRPHEDPESRDTLLPHASIEHHDPYTARQPESLEVVPTKLALAHHLDVKRALRRVKSLFQLRHDNGRDAKPPSAWARLKKGKLKKRALGKSKTQDFSAAEVQTENVHDMAQRDWSTWRRSWTSGFDSAKRTASSVTSKSTGIDTIASEFGLAAQSLRASVPTSTATNAPSSRRSSTRKRYTPPRAVIPSRVPLPSTASAKKLIHRPRPLPRRQLFARPPPLPSRRAIEARADADEGEEETASISSKYAAAERADTDSPLQPSRFVNVTTRRNVSASSLSAASRQDVSQTGSRNIRISTGAGASNGLSSRLAALQITPLSSPARSRSTRSAVSLRSISGSSAIGRAVKVDAGSPVPPELGPPRRRSWADVQLEHGAATEDDCSSSVGISSARLPPPSSASITMAHEFHDEMEYDTGDVSGSDNQDDEGDNEHSAGGKLELARVIILPAPHVRPVSHRIAAIVGPTRTGHHLEKDKSSLTSRTADFKSEGAARNRRVPRKSVSLGDLRRMGEAGTFYA